MLEDFKPQRPGCRATASASCSASPPGARATGRRSAASSTAAAAPAAGRGRHPALARPPPARPVALHHPAAGAGPGADPVRRVRGADHRHADRAADRQRGRALEGLLRRSRTSSAPATPTTPIRRKYGIRDYRGGGRSSARETAMRVAAGAVARKVLGEGVAHPRRTGADRPARRSIAPAGTGTRSSATRSGAPTRRRPRLGRVPRRACARPAPRPAASSRWWRRACPSGLGEPVYDKLDADLAKAMMGINAVKGVEIGDGFAAAAMSGAEHNDGMRDARRPAVPSSPTTPAASWAASRPARTSSPASRSSRPARSCARAAPSTVSGEEAEIVDQGPPRPLRRHPRRAGRRGDAGLVLADHLLRHRAQCG